jgi:hypothetical protein
LCEEQAASLTAGEYSLVANALVGLAHHGQDFYRHQIGRVCGALQKVLWLALPFNGIQ